jgi:hypothetical protein
MDTVLSAPNITADVRHACLDEYVVHAMHSKLRSSSVVTLVARSANEAVVGSGGVCVWRESGVRRSVLCWRV